MSESDDALRDIEWATRTDGKGRPNTQAFLVIEKQQALPYPILMSANVRARDDIQFIINDCRRKGVACCVRKRISDSTYSVWRHWLQDDPPDLYAATVSDLRRQIERDRVTIETYPVEGCDE